MEYSYNETRKRVKPITGGETEDEYRKVMHKIIEGLTKQNLETILFLCKDHIPQGRDIKTPLELFRYLEDKDLVSQDNAVFVAEVLHLVRRMDLLKVIPCIKNKRHFEDEYLACSYQYFSNYRVLTVHLQDELSERDFETFRFQCATHLKIRSLESAATVLALLKKLEEEDVISEDNFDELVKILEGIENVRPLKMFRRLLDGDDSVVLPASKQAKQQPAPAQDTRTENTSNHPMQQNSRVEMMPPGHQSTNPAPIPPAYYDMRHAEPIQHGDPQTAPKVWRGPETKVEPVTYEFGQTGTFFSTTGRCFHPGESTPKRVAGPPDPHPSRWQENEQHGQYQSMPAQWHEQLHRQRSDPTSLPPPGYDMQYEQQVAYPQDPLPRGATYPQNLGDVHTRVGHNQPYVHHRHHYHPVYEDSPGTGHRYHPGYEDNPGTGFFPHPQYTYDQQPYSYAGQPGHRVHRNVSYPSMPFVASTPERHPTDMRYIERGVGQMTMEPPREEAVNQYNSENHPVEKFLAEGEENPSLQQPANKASCTNVTVEPLKRKPPKPEESPEEKRRVEELQRMREELERTRLEQRAAGCYKMDHSPVGICVLINNVNFQENFNQEDYARRVELNKSKEAQERLELPRTDLLDRTGSNVDADKLENLFRSFDFDVKRHNNCDQREIKRVVKEYQTTNHWEYDCFVLIVLSHGDLGKVFGVCGYAVPITDIQGAFCVDKCESLANKPKILIIQACQGSRVMYGHCPEADVSPDGPKDGTTPNKADFLMAYSTVPGYQSYRSHVQGSHFITELVRIFKTNYETEDLLSMMIMVNNEMSMYAHKQVPMPVPTLRKKVFFRLKEGWVDPDEDEAEEEVLGASSSSGIAVQVSHVSSSSGSSGNTSASTPGSERKVAVQSYPPVFEDRGVGSQESGDQEF